MDWSSKITTGSVGLTLTVLSRLQVEGEAAITVEAATTVEVVAVESVGMGVAAHPLSIFRLVASIARVQKARMHTIATNAMVWGRRNAPTVVEGMPSGISRHAVSIAKDLMGLMPMLAMSVKINWQFLFRTILCQDSKAC
mmetsp:Transcript_85872/g.161696  ORF Transcript_85872/g.161696 Transcript_85872/m.161696 type:complete len:140 (+) Transcript_85872:449-868(+)